MIIPLHGVGSRQDLPLPFELVVLGAALTLVATFWLALHSWTSPRWSVSRGRALPRLTRLAGQPAVLWLGRLVAVGLLAIITLAAVAGPDRVSNPFPGFVFVWVWVGLVPLSLVFGVVWRALNPARTLLAWRAGQRPGDHYGVTRWGLYPAAGALAAFTWLELVQPDRATTAVLRWWALAWGVWVIGGALVVGPRWITSADPFEAYATTVARLSPWQRISGMWFLTNPLRALASTRAPRGLWAVCCVLLGGTAFDSLSNGPWWIQRTQASSLPQWVWGSLGLVGCLAVVGTTYALGVWAIARARPGQHLGACLDSLARSLVPIVIGYALAHYFTLLVLEGQRVLINLSDPLGRGENWFGTAECGVSGAIFDHAQTVAWAQVLLIVGAHVLGVALAHDISIRTLPQGRRRSAQMPLLLVMVFYTCAGLLLLFA